jgi:predicted dehydrogenase
MKKNVSRRNFIKTTAIAGTGMALLSEQAFANVLSKNENKVRIAFIGVGGRGREHVRNISLNPDATIVAFCDIDPKAVVESQKILKKNNLPAAEEYTKGPIDYKRMLERKDIDGVVISTPWEWHAIMAVDTMKSGKYAGVEVSAATTLEQCWDLVNTYEATGIPCMILENVCYGRQELAMLNMVKKGVFGEVVHARCGYLHDLRTVKFTGVEYGSKASSEAQWRTNYSEKINADVYPTHGLGPIAVALDINRGNRFLSISSIATKSRGLHEYIVENPQGGKNHPNADINWNLGDVVTSTIKTTRGETIIVTHDTNVPRPYSLGFKIQGTNGLLEFDGLESGSIKQADGKYFSPDRIYIEGKTPGHEWEAAEKWFKEYDHPLWAKFEADAKNTGHGGIDFFVAKEFVDAIKEKRDPELDVYDAAAWSAVTPLSEMSILENGEPQFFPDFTRGKWINRTPVEIK